MPAQLELFRVKIHRRYVAPGDRALCKFPQPWEPLNLVGGSRRNRQLQFDFRVHGGKPTFQLEPVLGNLSRRERPYETMAG